jgi:hypothetical protein
MSVKARPRKFAAKKRWRVKERAYRGVPLRRVFAFWRQCCATSQFVWRVTRQTDCQHLSDAGSEQDTKAAQLGDCHLLTKLEPHGPLGVALSTDRANARR